MSVGDSGAPLGLLLLEDSPADSRLLMESLRERVNDGTVVIQTVRCLADALRELKRFRFSCVLVDLGLPDGEGVATVSRIREADDAIAIVVLTGLADQRAADEAFRLGAQDYLIKGERLGNELLEFVQKAIDKRPGGHGSQRPSSGQPPALAAPRFQPWVYIGRGAFVGVHCAWPNDAEGLASILSTWRAWVQSSAVSGRLSFSLPSVGLLTAMGELSSAVAKGGVPATELAVRIPIVDSDRTEALIPPLTALRASGMDVWLEGWRPGNAPLETLTQLPLDGLVFDPSLVAAVTQEPAETSLRFVRVSLALGGALGLRVLADGVCLADQHARMALLGCGLMQGNWFCPAESAADLPARWRKGPWGLLR